MKHKVLIIDDDTSICSLLSLALSDKYDIFSAGNSKEGMTLLETQYGIEIVLLDLKLGAEDGLRVLERIKAHDGRIAVIMMTAYGSIRSSVDAMKKGAFTYLAKPIDIDELNIYIEQALNLNRMGDEISFLRGIVNEGARYHGIIGRSPAMQQVYTMIERLKNVDTTVLLLGESGTGKELVARALHTSGKRSKERFVTINCAAIPESLLEEELFGHRRGTFTGAVQDKKGKFEIANGGTIFLDEIGDMPLQLQSKLLRVIQQKEFTPLGGTEVHHVDVRIVAATNRNLREMAENGKFRLDLFYRLNIASIQMPPLRERKEDIVLLCSCFVEKFNGEQSKTIKGLSPEAQRLLEAYDYPGNVRQLENAIEFAMIFSDGNLIEASALPLELRQNDGAFGTAGEKTLEEQLSGKTMKEIEKIAIVSALQRNHGRRDHSARELGISVRSLQNKIAEYEI